MEEKDAVKKFKDHFEKIKETRKTDLPILSDLSDDPVLNAIVFPNMLVFLKSSNRETPLNLFPLN